MQVDSCAILVVIKTDINPPTVPTSVLIVTDVGMDSLDKIILKTCRIIKEINRKYSHKIFLNK